MNNCMSERQVVLTHEEPVPFDSFEGIMDAVMAYLYPLVKDAAEASAKESIRMKLYDADITSWDLIKVIKAIDGVVENKEE